MDDGVIRLPDGSAFCTASLPLPKDHWLYADHTNDPPMPWKIGTDDAARGMYVQKVREAARYAIRTATANGKLEDFDPDAMVQNFVVGMLGYYTPDGTSSTSDLFVD